jgi:hypothetical protein
MSSAGIMGSGLFILSPLNSRGKKDQKGFCTVYNN